MTLAMVARGAGRAAEFKDIPASDVAPTLERAIRKQVTQIEALRDAGIFAGVIHWDGVSPAIQVQLRGPQDRANLQDLRSGALAGIGAVFRDADNAAHTLTAEQVLAMTGFALGWGQAWFAAAWAHKDAVRALGSVSAVRAYDITTGWPA